MMKPFVPLLSAEPQADPLLRIYLLGQVDFERVLALQRALVYQATLDAESAALVVCETDRSLITVGPAGQPGAHSLQSGGIAERGALAGCQLQVNRGGGCWLHLPGQLAVYQSCWLPRIRPGCARLSAVRLQPRLRSRAAEPNFHWRAAAGA